MEINFSVRVEDAPPTEGVLLRDFAMSKLLLECDQFHTSPIEATIPFLLDSISFKIFEGI